MQLDTIESTYTAGSSLADIGLWCLAFICVGICAASSYWLARVIANQPYRRRDAVIYCLLLIPQTILPRAFDFITSVGVTSVIAFSVIYAVVIFRQRKLALLSLSIKLFAAFVTLEAICGLLILPFIQMGITIQRLVIDQMADFCDVFKVIIMHGISAVSQIILGTLIILCRRAGQLVKCKKNSKSWLYAKVFIRLSAMVLLGSGVLYISTTTYLPQFTQPNFLANNTQYIVQVGLAGGLLLVAGSYLIQDIRYIQQIGRNETLERQQAISRSTLQNLRYFRHNMINMIYGLEGVMLNGDTEELQAYYQDMEKRCALVNNENIIALERLNHSAINAILLRAIDAAREKELPITLYVQEGIRVARSLSASDICQVLGVLLDNALEASEQSTHPLIMVEIRNVDNMMEMIVKNTYAGQVDEALLLHGDHSTKENHMGQGLLSCYDMLKRKDTAFLNFDVSEHHVRAQLLIEM